HAVLGRSKCGWAVVDVEQNSIEMVPAGTDRTCYVAQLDPDTFVFKRMICQWAQRPTVPLHDGRNQFGDDNLSVGGKKIQRCAHGEPHAKTANEYTRRSGSSKFAASERREG